MQLESRVDEVVDILCALRGCVTGERSVLAVSDKCATEPKMGTDAPDEIPKSSTVASAVAPRCLCQTSRNYFETTRDGDRVCIDCGVVVGRMQEGQLYEKPIETHQRVYRVDMKRASDSDTRTEKEKQYDGIKELLSHWAYALNIPEPCIEDMAIKARPLLGCGRTKACIIAAIVLDSKLDAFPSSHRVSNAMRTQQPLPAIQPVKPVKYGNFRCARCNAECQSGRAARLHCIGNPVFGGVGPVPIAPMPVAPTLSGASLAKRLKERGFEPPPKRIANEKKTGL